LRFPGQWACGHADQVYNRFRWYVPAWGRYLTPDPLGIEGGSDGFAYCDGDPFNRIDVLGLSCTPKSSPSATPPSDAGGTPTTPPKTPGDGPGGPIGDISPNEVAGQTPSQIDANARALGLTPKGPDPSQGRGAYVDPETGVQRILSHPNADPPHGHVNNPSGERIDINGNVVPPESQAAHLPIRTEKGPE
jgi:RHS repeat-associated protein